MLQQGQKDVEAPPSSSFAEIVPPRRTTREEEGKVVYIAFAGEDDESEVDI